MRRAAAVAIAALALAGPVAGCGDDDDDEGAGDAEPAQTQQQEARVELPTEEEIDSDPTILTCAHLSDAARSAPLSRRATVALADELLERNPEFARKNSRLQTSQAIFVGMTELCKDAEPEFRPAEKAVEGVEAGKYGVDF